MKTISLSPEHTEAGYSAGLVDTTRVPTPGYVGGNVLVICLDGKTLWSKKIPPYQLVNSLRREVDQAILFHKSGVTLGKEWVANRVPKLDDLIERVT